MTNVWIGTDFHLFNEELDPRHRFRTDRNLEQLAMEYSKDIQADDVFIYLGDLCDPAATDKNRLRCIVENIPGYKVLCKGNHDTEQDSYYYDVGFDLVCDVAIMHHLVFSHKPLVVPMDCVNIHGHLHDRQLSNLTFQHIDAWNKDFLKKPLLLEDILDMALDKLPKDTDLSKGKQNTGEYNTFNSIDHDVYIPERIVDISDKVDLYPMDETADGFNYNLQMQLKELSTPEQLFVWMRRNLHVVPYTKLKSDVQILQSHSGSSIDMAYFAHPRLRSMGKMPRILMIHRYNPDNEFQKQYRAVTYWDEPNEYNGDHHYYLFAPDENTSSRELPDYNSLAELKEDIRRKYKELKSHDPMTTIKFYDIPYNHFQVGMTLNELMDSIDTELNENAAVGLPDDFNVKIAPNNKTNGAVQDSSIQHWCKRAEEQLTVICRNMQFDYQTIVVDFVLDHPDGKVVDLPFGGTYIDTVNDKMGCYVVVNNEVSKLNRMASSEIVVCVVKHLLDIQNKYLNLPTDNDVLSAVAYYLTDYAMYDIMCIQYEKATQEERCRYFYPNPKIKGYITLLYDMQKWSENNTPWAYIRDIVCGRASLQETASKVPVERGSEHKNTYDKILYLNELLFDDPDDTKLFLADDDLEKHPKPANLKTTLDIEDQGVIAESADKSVMDKDYKSKDKLKLSDFDLTVKEYTSDGIRGVHLTWKDGSTEVGHVVTDIDKASDGNIWFGSLEVKKAYRGHGLSEQILDYAIKKYGSNALTVYKDNEVAINLYKKMGFKIVKNASNVSDKYYTMIRGSLNEDAYTFMGYDRHEEDAIAKKYGITPVGHTIETAEEKAERERIERIKKERAVQKKREKALKAAHKAKKKKDAERAKAKKKELRDQKKLSNKNETNTDDTIRFFDPYAAAIDFNESVTKRKNNGPMLTPEQKLFFLDKEPTAQIRDDQLLYPVYVLIVHHVGAILGDSIKKVTHSHFSHASIAFDSSLKRSFSFGTKQGDNPNVGAFITEDIDTTLSKYPNTVYALYMVSVTAEELTKMQKRLEYFITSKTKFKYDFGGLFLNWVGISNNPETRYFCSRFVADIINAGKTSNDPHMQDPSLMRPEDFLYNDLCEFVTTGKLAEYDQAAVDKQVRKMLRLNTMKMQKIKSQEEAKKNVAMHEACIYNLNPFDPYQEAVLGYQLTALPENSLDSFLGYMKSFKIRTDENGNIIYTRQELDLLTKYYHDARNVIQHATDNETELSNQLCRLGYMIKLIDQYYLNSTTTPNKRVKGDLRSEMVDLRASIIRTFNAGIAYMKAHFPQYNYNNAYEASKYSEEINVSNGTLTSIGKVIDTNL